MPPVHYASGHPEYTKRSILYSQLLRVSRICSPENDFNQHKSNMKIWFQKRGYPENIIKNEMKKVKFLSCNKVQRNQSKGILFAVNYHPLLKQLEGILRRNNYLPNINYEVKQTFTYGPMAFSRSFRKLRSYLVRVKLYPIVIILGSKCCCNVCEADTFSSTVTGETIKINHKLKCNDKCPIYLFKCKCCGKQYE